MPTHSLLNNTTYITVKHFILHLYLLPSPLCNHMCTINMHVGISATVFHALDNGISLTLTLCVESSRSTYISQDIHRECSIYLLADASFTVLDNIQTTYLLNLTTIQFEGLFFYFSLVLEASMSSGSRHTLGGSKH